MNRAQIIIVPLVLLLMSGCGGGEGPLNPSSEPPELSGIHHGPANGDDSNRHLWGLWTISLSGDHQTLEISPLRSAGMHVNLVGMLETSPCDDCLTFENFKSYPPDGIAFNLTLEHPIEDNLNLTGFDVRGIFLFERGYEFPVSGKTIPWGDDVPKILNPDGYTNLFNPTEFPQATFYPYYIGYIPGERAFYAPDEEVLALVNPYMAYGLSQPRRMFNPGTTQSTIIAMKVPPGPVEFAYAVDGSWEHVDFPVDDPVNDFPPEANCVEAYRIDANVDGSIPMWQWSTVGVEVEVFDHQSTDTISTVILEAPDIFIGEMALESQGPGGDDSLIFSGEIVNEFGVVPGIYPMLVRATDTEEDPYFGQIDAWQVFDLNVATTAVSDPIATGSAYPVPQNINGQVWFHDNGSYDPDGGDIVLREWDWDDDGIFDEEGDFITHSWSTAGMYEINYRVTDDEGAQGNFNFQVTIEEDKVFNPVYVTPPELNMRLGEIFIQGDYMYIDNNHHGFLVMDISDPASPEYVTLRDTWSNSKFLGIDSNFVYSCLYIHPTYMILRAFDISNPTDPVFFGSTRMVVVPDNMAITGGYGYFIKDSEIHIRQLAPTLGHQYMTTTLPLGTATEIAADSEYIYTAGHDSGLQIFSIADPWRPEYVGGAAVEYPPNDLDIVGDLAYVTCPYWMLVYDISEVTAPVLLKSIPNGGGADSVIDGDFIYAAQYGGAHQYGLMTVVNRHTDETVVETQVPSPLKFINKVGNYIYTTDDLTGIFVYDVSNPESPDVVETYGTVGYTGNIDVVDDICYLTSLGGFRVIDVSLPEEARLIGDLLDLGGAADLHVSDSIAYYLSGTGLTLIDVMDPSMPSVLSNTEMNLNFSVEANNGYAYVSSYSSIRIVDVDPPETAYQVATYMDFYGYKVRAIDIHGNTLYIATENGVFNIVDVTDPVNPWRMNSINITERAWDMQYHNGYCFIANFNGTMVVVDVDPPMDSHVVRWLDFDGAAYEIDIDDGYAYVAAGTQGVKIFDIDPPLSTHEVWTISVGSHSFHVEVQDNYLYVSTLDEGLKIFNLYN